MTSMDSHDTQDTDTRGTDAQDTLARSDPNPSESAVHGPDPVHPGVTDSPRVHTGVQSHPQAGHGEPPRASDLGAPAVLDHQVVAVEVGSTAGPVAIHRWTGDRVGTQLLTPTQAQVWARAGRLTLVTSAGEELALTMLSPEEGATAALGAHWPLGEPESRVLRVATAAAHDVGDLLTFPTWLARTAHRSGERNRQLARVVHEIRTASPSTVVYYGQTFGHMHARPDQHHPYDHKGLVGHEGYPDEL
jgi:hypothetical protein